MIKLLIEQGSEAWFEARTGRVTGTRFATMMMGDTTKGYKDLILDLAGEIITGEVEESYSNAVMERGKELEPEARDLYKEIMETDVDEVGFIMFDDDNPFSDWTGVSPDGVIVGDVGLLEIKCPLRKTHLKYIDKGVLPNEYRHQVQGQLFVSGLPYCDFMSYYPGMKPFIVRVNPDKELHKEYERDLEKLIKAVTVQILSYNKYDYEQE